MNTDFLNIISDKDKLKRELIFYSLFLMTFENFVSHWNETLRFFYSHSFATDDETGKFYDFAKVEWKDGKRYVTIDKEQEKQFSNEVLQGVRKNGKNYPKLSMFQRMVRFGIIDNQDYDILEKCYDKRNEYAHSIIDCLERFVTKEEKDLLLSLIAVSKKASKNWFYEVELPTSPEFELNKFVDEKGNFNPSEIITGTDVLYSLIVSNLEDIFDDNPT